MMKNDVMQVHGFEKRGTVLTMLTAVDSREV
jgi:hypothetical protein